MRGRVEEWLDRLPPGGDGLAGTLSGLGIGTLAMVLLFGVWLLAVNVLLLAGYHAILEYQQADADGG